MAALLFDQALLPEGWRSAVRIVAAGGRIASIETGVAAGPNDERHAIALPGMPNLHSHAFQRGMAGLAEVRGPAADTFWTWRETMYRFALSMSPDDVEAVAAQLYVEMLEAGYTRVGEFHYLHHDLDGSPYSDPAEMAARVAAAAAETGIGLTLLPVFYAHATFGGSAPLPEQRRFISDPELFGRLLDESRRIVRSLDGANFGVAPHSLRAVTPGELAILLEAAPRGPVHIHAAEQIREVEDSVAALGARPVEWLLDNAPLDARWCVIHATHMTAEETAGLARSGAVAGLCPVTEANLGDGIFNGPGFVENGGRYGIGTDSNIRIGVADELRQLEYAQRLAARARNVMAHRGSTGRNLLDAAAKGGSQALGAGEGGLRVGEWADIVSLRSDHAALVGRSGNALLDSWIFGGGDGAIDCVWSRGAKQVADGGHRCRPAIERRYAATLERLLA